MTLRSLAAPAAFVLLGAWVPARAQERPPEAVEILDGVDPVLLLEGKEVPGREELSAVHAGYRYLFASAETRARFAQDPARYEPALGGACARMGARTAGTPQLFAVHGGRIYLFGSDNCLRLFQASPERYLEGTRPAASPSREAIARGGTLLDQAAQAIGGGRLDSLSAWRLETTRGQPASGGAAPQVQVQTVALPDRVREERRASFGTVINVDTPAEAFGLFVPPDGAWADDLRPAPQRRALGEAVRREASRALFSLLRSRRAPGVTAAAVGAARAGEVPVELVEVRGPLGAATLAIDPRSGRVLEERYRDRGPDGAFGEIALVLSDYRDVGGWTLPFAVAGSFDGKPAPALGYTVVSWTLDPPVEAALFSRPPRAPAGR